MFQDSIPFIIFYIAFYIILYIAVYITFIVFHRGNVSRAFPRTGCRVCLLVRRCRLSLRRECLPCFHRLSSLGNIAIPPVRYGKPRSLSSPQDGILFTSYLLMRRASTWLLLRISKGIAHTFSIMRALVDLRILRLRIFFARHDDPRRARRQISRKCVFLPDHDGLDRLDWRQSLVEDHRSREEGPGSRGWGQHCLRRYRRMG